MKRFKRLAIFCDGTWNDLRAGSITNVARLAKCVDDFGPDPDKLDKAGIPKRRIPQLVFYDEGVGVSSDIWAGVDKAVQLVGGAFGRGLDRKIEAAYRFLVLNFDPGDEIYVFGFSRGAYTARSLCGLIRKCGIVRRNCFDAIPEAMKRYRDSTHPKGPEMTEFRQRFSHLLKAGEEDDWVPPLAVDGKEDIGRRSDYLAPRDPNSYFINYLGVWDTVGSLGIPERFQVISFLSAFNDKYRFHDTKMSGLIASVRHAVSIEERRKVLEHTPIRNILELNAEWAQRTKWDVFGQVPERFVPYHYRPYQQVWWPGDHGAVGSGNPELGLSSATLLWIAEGAMAAGLVFRSDKLNELLSAVETVNPLANWRIHKDGKPFKPGETELLGDIGGYRTRSGPQTVDEVSMTARLKWCADPTWRPENLDVLKLAPCPVPPPAPAPTGFPELPKLPQPPCYPKQALKKPASEKEDVV